jgi:hypothetical protein
MGIMDRLLNRGSMPDSLGLDTIRECVDMILVLGMVGTNPDIVIGRNHSLLTEEGRHREQVGRAIVDIAADIVFGDIEGTTPGIASYIRRYDEAHNGRLGEHYKSNGGLDSDKKPRIEGSGVLVCIAALQAMKERTPGTSGWFNGYAEQSRLGRTEEEINIFECIEDEVEASMIERFPVQAFSSGRVREARRELLYIAAAAEMLGGRNFDIRTEDFEGLVPSEDPAPNRWVALRRFVAEARRSDVQHN